MKNHQKYQFTNFLKFDINQTFTVKLFERFTEKLVVNNSHQQYQFLTIVIPETITKKRFEWGIVKLLVILVILQKMAVTATGCDYYRRCYNYWTNYGFKLKKRIRSSK